MKMKQKLQGFFAKTNNQAKTAVALAFIFLAVSPSQAAWSTAVGNGKLLTQGLVTLLTGLCALAGVGAFAFAGKQLLKKGGDRGDDIEWSKIGYAVLAGVFLIAVAWVALQSVETMGGAGSDMGKAIIIGK